MALKLTVRETHQPEDNEPRSILTRFAMTKTHSTRTISPIIYRARQRRYTFGSVRRRVASSGSPKSCIGLIVGLVAHRAAKINESTDKKYIFRWSVIASVAGLGFNVIADPLVGYFYKQYVLGQPQQMAEVLAKWSTATTFVNAVVSTILVAFLYNVLRPVLLKSGLLDVRSQVKERTV